MDILKTFFLLFIPILFYPNKIISQDFSTPEIHFSGNAAMVFESTYLVSDQHSAFSFKNKEWIKGDVFKISSKKQYLEYTNYGYQPGSIISDLLFIPNKEGYIEKGVLNGIRKNIGSEIQFDYDASGQLTHIKYINSNDNNPISEIEYVYKKKNLIKSIHKKKDVIRFEYFFEDNSVKKIKKYDTTGKLIRISTIQVNDKKLPTLILEKDKDGKIIEKVTYEYSYDNMGNFTKRLSKHHSSCQQLLTERKFVYRKDISDKNLSSESFVGHWKNINDEMVVILEEDGTSKVIKDAGFTEIPSKYEYSSYSEELLLKLEQHSPAQHFTATINGRFLSLYGNGHRAKHFHLERISYPKKVKDAMDKMNEFQWDGKYTQIGLKDKSGKIIYSESYHIIATGEKGFIIRNEVNKYALGDFKGNFITDFIYDRIALVGSKYFIVKKDNLTGIIDSKGNIIIPIEHRRLSAYNDQKIISFETSSNKLGLTIHDTNNSNSTRYEKILNLKGDKKFGLKNRKILEWEILDKDFNIIKKIKGYQSIKKIAYNRYKGSLPEEKSVVFDSIGTIIFNTDFKDIRAINDFLFIVRQENKYGLMDADGNLLSKVEYDIISNVFKTTNYSMKIESSKNRIPLIYQKGNEVGYMNSKGEEINFQYQERENQSFGINDWTNKEKSFKFKKSFNWSATHLNHVLKYDDIKDNYTYVEYKIHTRKSGSLKEDVRSITSSMRYLAYAESIPTKTDSHSAYYLITNPKYGYPEAKHYRKDIFIELNKDEILHFTFMCKYSNLHILAYDFSMMENTIKILQNN